MKRNLVGDKRPVSTVTRRDCPHPAGRGAYLRMDAVESLEYAGRAFEHESRTISRPFVWAARVSSLFRHPVFAGAPKRDASRKWKIRSARPRLGLPELLRVGQGVLTRPERRPFEQITLAYLQLSFRSVDDKIQALIGPYSLINSTWAARRSSADSDSAKGKVGPGRLWRAQAPDVDASQPTGRDGQIYEAIVRGRRIRPACGVVQRVVRELQSLCLDVSLCRRPRAESRLAEPMITTDKSMIQ